MAYIKAPPLGYGPKTILPLFHCTTRLIDDSTIRPLYRCTFDDSTIPPNYHSTTLPLYHCTIWLPTNQPNYHSTIRRSDDSTIRHAVIRPDHHSTTQRFNTSKVRRFDDSMNRSYHHSKIEPYHHSTARFDDSINYSTIQPLYLSFDWFYMCARKRKHASTYLEALLSEILWTPSS